jgi:hypothetical protein
VNPKIRLGPLPKTKTVRITVVLTAALKESLDRYAALHSDTWGTKIVTAALIPHMLDAFIKRDRGFRKLPR